MQAAPRFGAGLTPPAGSRLLQRRCRTPPALSNNSLTALAKGLAFMHGLLCDARKLTHIALTSVVIR